jgi:hypothetical protein
MAELQKIKPKDPVQFRFADGKTKTVHSALAAKLAAMGKGELATEKKAVKSEEKTETKIK